MLCSGSVPRQRMELGSARLVSGTVNCPTHPQPSQHKYFPEVGWCPESTLTPHSFPILPGYPFFPYVHMCTHTSSIPWLQAPSSRASQWKAQ